MTARAAAAAATRCAWDPADARRRRLSGVAVRRWLTRTLGRVPTTTRASGIGLAGVDHQVDDHLLQQVLVAATTGVRASSRISNRCARRSSLRLQEVQHRPHRGVQIRAGCSLHRGILADPGRA